METFSTGLFKTGIYVSRGTSHGLKKLVEKFFLIVCGRQAKKFRLFLQKQFGTILKTAFCMSKGTFLTKNILLNQREQGDVGQFLSTTKKWWGGPSSVSETFWFEKTLCKEGITIFHQNSVAHSTKSFLVRDFLLIVSTCQFLAETSLAFDEVYAPSKRWILWCNLEIQKWNKRKKTKSRQESSISFMKHRLKTGGKISYW